MNAIVLDRIEADRVLAAAAVARQLAELARQVRTGSTNADESLRLFSEQLFQAAQASREHNIEGLLMLVAQMVVSEFITEAVAAVNNPGPLQLASQIAGLLDVVTEIEEEAP